MFSIICRPEIYEQVRKAINGNIHFESTTNAKDSLEKAARVSSTVLILDVDTGSAAEIITGIKKYRVARPETRIILLAQGREPGDQLIASLVGKGVYDIIAPPLPEPDEDKGFDLTEEIKRLLEGQPATYADAVRWDTVGDEDDHKREIIYRERLIGTGYIVVTGAGRAAGSTTMAIAMAEYLARRGYKVALVEMNRYPVFWRVKDMFHKNIELFIQAKDFCVYLDKLDNLIHQIEGLYNYVVVDLGSSYEPNTANHGVNEPTYSAVKWHDYLHEMSRAALPVLVLGPALWQWANFLPLYVNNKIDKHLKIVASNKVAFKGLKEYGKIHYCPTILDPFNQEKGEITVFLEKMLTSIMPKDTKRMRKLSWRTIVSMIKR